ncbi:CLUMA_CG002108, isoform A [Clunio marinus]|uniref:CLUMA_CG002108, isoform A n=1 Tax=Clunio marinus TaxID=568069 RepID=A0A1J1HQ39_9DIPT|nr:CLUMA_CG002108, isoform A [Clunio marinus]
MSKSYTNGKRYTNNVRIEGKIVIITGANAGIGKATALDLAKRGGKIYMACRNQNKGIEAVNEVKAASGNDNVFFLQLDLASLESIREFSKKFHEIETRLDILINNAGVLSPLERTKEKFELNMGVNHLGHFLLTNLLLDLLKQSAPSRIVVVASQLHKIGAIDKENFNSEKSFAGSWKAYANSKLANILFTRELSKRLEGTGVTINALCPGAVDTDATKYLNPIMRFLMTPLKKLFYKSPENGAQTSIMLAVEPELEKVSGKYYETCQESTSSEKSKDDEMAAWLWELSDEKTTMVATVS